MEIRDSSGIVGRRTLLKGTLGLYTVTSLKLLLSVAYVWDITADTDAASYWRVIASLFRSGFSSLPIFN